MKLRCILSIAALTSVLLSAQMLDPAKLLIPPTDTWPTYNGDYSGRRFSPLTQINQSNVNSLRSSGCTASTSARSEAFGGPHNQIHAAAGQRHSVLHHSRSRLRRRRAHRRAALAVRVGEDKGGHLVGQRGVGMYGNWLYFLTPDGWFISLNAKDGKERWRKKIADEKLQYFTTMAPLVVRNHVIVGVGGDAMDVRGYLESRDPETGDLQWRWYSEPRKPGEPGAETWPNQARWSMAAA